MNNRNSAPDRTGLLAELGKQVSLVFKLLMDNRVPLSHKILLPMLAAGYFIFPIDLIPDFLPGLGQLDDLAVILLVMRLFVILSPQDIVAQYRSQAAGRRAAQGEPGSDKEAPDDGQVIEGSYRVLDQ